MGFVINNPVFSDGPRNHAEFSCGIDEHHRLAIDEHDYIAAPIARLLLPAGPDTVPGFIVAVIIEALDRRVRWRAAHVDKKISKTLPPLADLDAAAPIVPERKIIGIPASLPHPMPNIIFAAFV